ncbi:MAG: tRNA 2-thiouridine(34) synthase MnmA [Vicinamibacterales bacterium]
MMRIVVAMSGGVDSSVAAALLADAGYDVVGISMQLYDQSDAERDGTRAFGSCCSLSDLNDARRVAAAIDIPHYVVNLERQFSAHVVSNFVREYTTGRTPLPCAHCNGDLKFSTLVDRAFGFGAEAVATGHYARVERDETTGRFHLLRGADAAKDQSYFLFSLTQPQLAVARFPVGDRSKEDVRAYARARCLPVADKPDSQEICFVPDDDYAAFIEKTAPAALAPGVITDQAGRVLGRHEGIHRYTVGQRKGLGIANSPSGAPLYVIALKPLDHKVVVGPKSSLERTTLTASGMNWIQETAPGGRRVHAQIRHRHRPAPATVYSIATDRASVLFDEPQLAITPGQAVVCYDGDHVVCGGWIDEAV